MSMRMHIPAIAAAAVLALGSTLAWAQVTPRQEDRAQLNSDLASLAMERAKLSADTQTLKADRAEGKMAAESRDSLRVYHDRQDIKGETQDLRADPARSLQAREDRMELRHDRTQLKRDEQRLRHDSHHGLMAATSPDAERVYQDRLAIAGQERAIATDTAHLKADNSAG